MKQFIFLIDQHRWTDLCKVELDITLKPENNMRKFVYEALYINSVYEHKY